MPHSIGVSPERYTSGNLARLELARTDAFDAPDTNVTCPERNVSVNAPQALTLLNSNLVVEYAKALASRIRNDQRGTLNLLKKLRSAVLPDGPRQLHVPLAGKVRMNHPTLVDPEVSEDRITYRVARHGDPDEREAGKEQERGHAATGRSA